MPTYGQKVLGRHVVIQFVVSGGSRSTNKKRVHRLQPYLGKISGYRVSLDADDNIETFHTVEFTDGDVVEFDLQTEENMGRLTWVKEANEAEIDTFDSEEEALLSEEEKYEESHPPAKKKRPAPASTSTNENQKRSPGQPLQRMGTAHLPTTPMSPFTYTEQRQHFHEADTAYRSVFKSPNQVRRQTSSRSGELEVCLDKMFHWMTRVPHGWGRSKKVMSRLNARNVLRQVEKLISGEGITYNTWPNGTYFYRNQKVDLSFNFKKMLQEAKEFEDTYGDNSFGWLLRHPIRKLQLFKEYITK